VIRTSSLLNAYQMDFAPGSARTVGDVPLDKSGGGVGFAPHELLEAALATSMNLAVHMKARELGIALDGVSAAVRLNRSRPGFATFEYAIEFTGYLTVEDRERLHEAADTCPVRQMLTGSMEFVEMGFAADH
jgi:putative redox protein